MFVFTVSYTSGSWSTVVNLRCKSLFYCLPWNDSKQTTEQLLSTAINTEKQFKATLFVSFEVYPAGLPNALRVCWDAEYWEFYKQSRYVSIEGSRLLCVQIWAWHSDIMHHCINVNNIFLLSAPSSWSNGTVHLNWGHLFLFWKREILCESFLWEVLYK